jgi:acyl-CoA thioesterase-1
MIRLSYLFPLLFTLLACSENPMLAKLNSTSPILAFGDSLTFGYGATIAQSYPSVLSELTGLNVINAGINGEVSIEGLKRLEDLLDQHQPQLLLICHGANDMLQKRNLQKMSSNLEAMIKLAQDRKIQVLLIAVPKTNLLLTPLKQYQEVATKMNVPLENDLISDVLSKPSQHSDIIHPNALGYQKMAEKIYQDLISLGAL